MSPQRITNFLYFSPGKKKNRATLKNMRNYIRSSCNCFITYSKYDNDISARRVIRQKYIRSTTDAKLKITFDWCKRVLLKKRSFYAFRVFAKITERAHTPSKNVRRSLEASAKNAFCHRKKKKSQMKSHSFVRRFLRSISLRERRYSAGIP